MNNFPTGDVVTNNKLFTLNFFCTELQAGFLKKFFWKCLSKQWNELMNHQWNPGPAHKSRPVNLGQSCL